MLRPCLLTTIIARVFREGVRSNTYKSLWSISWNKVALFINIRCPINNLAGLILLLVRQKGQLLRCEVKRRSMVGGGAPKEKDPVPNPVQRWGDIFCPKHVFQVYPFKPGKGLTSPGIRSRPKRSPFLPRPNLATHLVMGALPPR